MAKNKCRYANLFTKATAEKNKFGGQKIITEVFCPFHPANERHRKITDQTKYGNDRVEKFCMNRGYNVYGNHTLYVCCYHPEKDDLGQSKNYIAVHEE